MGSELVKQDINLMENPLWALSENPAKEIKISNDRGEYILRSGYKVPERVDMNFLLYLLMTSQKKGYVKTFELTRYDVLKSCGMGARDRDYARLEDSLQRWKLTGISFKGTFYDNKEYLIKSFNILNGFSIDKKTKKLKVKLNEDFLMMIKNSNFCKYINFDEYKKLRKPISSRLYEILLKTFKDRKEWEIEALKLAEKLTLWSASNEKHYASDVKAKVIPAINEINKKTELEIEFEARKNNQDQTIFKFKLIKDLQITKQELENETDNIKSLAEMLREGFKENKNLLEALRTHFNKSGYDYVKNNIIYANSKASKAYIGFLKNALKENWGDEIRQAEEKKQEEIKLKAIKAEEEKLKEAEAYIQREQEYHENQKISDFVSALNKKDRVKFINSIFDYLEDKDQNSYKIAKMHLNINKEITGFTVGMLSDAFKFCYNNYIQTNKISKKAKVS
jgi:hypothetical protein